MRRDWVHSASEVHVVGEVELAAALETLSHGEPQEEIAPQTVLLTVLLMLLEQLQLLAEGSLSNHFGSNGSLVVPRGDHAQASSDRPDVLDDFQHSLVKTPCHTAKLVHDIADRRQVTSSHVLDCLSELRGHLRQLRLFQVEASEVVVLPRSRFVDHREGPLHLQIEIVNFVQLSHESFHEGLVEDEVALELQLVLLDFLRLQKKVISRSDLVLQILRHQVCEESTDLELRMLGKSAYFMIFSKKPVLHLGATVLMTSTLLL